jgi:predicted flavoprotein YhiN
VRAILLLHNGRHYVISGPLITATQEPTVEGGKKKNKTKQIKIKLAPSQEDEDTKIHTRRAAIAGLKNSNLARKIKTKTQTQVFSL